MKLYQMVVMIYQSFEKCKNAKLFNGKAAVDNPTPAGLLTSRQWLAAHAIAGTNRRPGGVFVKRISLYTT